MPSNKTISILLVVTSIAVIGLFLYGYAIRPELTYKLSTIIDYNETYDFSSGELPIVLYLKNIGKRPVDVRIVVRLYNSSLNDYNMVDKGIFYQTEIELDSSIKAGETENKTIYYSPEPDHEYIAMLFYLEPIRDFNPVSSFDESFVGFTQDRPTALLMKHVNEGIYMRVKSR